jgi:DNA replication protein DnaC
MPKTTNRSPEQQTRLTQRNVTAMADVFADVALRAAKEGLSHEASLSELARLETEQRTQRRTARLVRTSGLPVEKTFRTLALSRLSASLHLPLERLKSASFQKTATNILAIGKPGVGKSPCLAAVGYAVIEAGSPVLWTPTSALVQRLLAAKRDLRLPHELAKLDTFACVILDDIGSVQHDRDEMEVLCTFLAERYERQSVMITTNVVFSEWERIFKNPMTTMAALDRLVHHSVILDMRSVERDRAEVARPQHLSSARPKKLSDKHVTRGEAAPSLPDSDPSQGPPTLASEHASTATLVVESRAEDPLMVGSKPARFIATDGPVSLTSISGETRPHHLCSSACLISLGEGRGSSSLERFDGCSSPLCAPSPSRGSPDSSSLG